MSSISPAPGHTLAPGLWRTELGYSSGAPELKVVASPPCSEPLVARSAAVTLVLDGELHERGELRRTAGAAPPEDDAALLLRAYERLGSGLFSSLRGNFSLTIWDASDSTLLSLRDPMGTRPLFYSVLGRGLLLSPFIDALLQHPDVPSTVDRVVAAGHLLSIAPGPEETMFEAVRRLPAGRLMRFRAGVRTMTRYWDPEARSDLPATAEAQTEQFEHLLHQAVRRCLEPARSAISLSGGLDSATVAAAAVRVSEKLALPAPVAVSFFNPTADANEETTQRRVAAGLGLNQIAGAVDDLVPSGDPLRASLRLAKASATPPALLASASDALCARAARQGCRVILTGDGGDEWLLPAPVWAADRMLRLDLSGLRRLYRAWYHYFPAQRRRSVARGVLWHWGARPLLRGAVGQLLARWAPQQLHRWRTRTVTAPMPGWVAPDPRLRRDLVDWVMTRTPVIAPSRLYEETRREWLEDASFSLMMEEAFSSGVRLGMRTRMPLMDPDLISLLYRLPQGDLLRGGQAKAFAREYLSSSLDFAHSWPRTIYADSVWDATMATEGGDAWRELGGAPTLSDLGLIDGCAVDGFMRAHRAGGPIRRAADVWEVMSLESWLRGRASADFGNPG